MNLQDKIFEELIRDCVPVTLYMMNGFQVRGTVTGHDDAVIVVVTDGKQQVFYKHGVSTIAPIRALKCLQK